MEDITKMGFCCEQVARQSKLGQYQIVNGRTEIETNLPCHMAAIEALF